MRRCCVIVGLFVAFFVAGASRALAQEDGFIVGHADVGPTLGLGGIGDASLSIGGRFEQGIKQFPNARNGVLGIGVSVDYYHYDDPFLNSNYGFKYIPIAVTANYHFRLDNAKIDPFVGAGLGYLHASFDLDCSALGLPSSCDDSFDSGGVYFVGHAGIRYFWQPSAALYADVGAGAATLNVGVVFKLK